MPSATAQPTHSDGNARSTKAHVPPLPSPHAPTVSGSVSGGESGAGDRLERLLELSASCKGRDVVLVVYRWYGGVKLGSERWKCISDVSKEALSLAVQSGWK